MNPLQDQTYQVFALVHAGGALGRSTQAHTESVTSCEKQRDAKLHRRCRRHSLLAGLTRGPATPGRPTGPLLPLTPCQTQRRWLVIASHFPVLRLWGTRSSETTHRRSSFAHLTRQPVRSRDSLSERQTPSTRTHRSHVPTCVSVTRSHTSTVGKSEEACYRFLQKELVGQTKLIQVPPILS